LPGIKANGFMEVYHSGTEKVEMKTGHNFKIATLPSIVLLKLIAFDDRPEQRFKDARDIANIITHFFDLQADLIYEKHTDLFTDENDGRSMEETASIVIGREIKKIANPNDSLMRRLNKILQSHIDLKDESLFIRNMVAETNGTVEISVQLLKNIFLSL
jgi:predicted nucleotidyltransferase